MIAAAKPKAIVNYGKVNDSNRSTCELMREHWSSKVRANVRLVRVTAGYEPAGSMARWTDGYYAVRWNDHTNAIQGRRYLIGDLDSAEKHYDSLTWADYGKFAWQKVN